MKRPRNAAQRLRTAVEMLPRHTREAMLRGIDDNEIVVGAYTYDGGVCPMLAAHRNGGRTSFPSFARAWDRFTSASPSASRARRATEREMAVLRSYLELSLLADDQRERPLSELAAEIRSDRERQRAAEAAARRVERAERTADRRRGERPGDPNRAPELRERRGWSWMRPVRSVDEWDEVLVAASEQAAEARAADTHLDRVST